MRFQTYFFRSLGLWLLGQGLLLWGSAALWASEPPELDFTTPQSTILNYLRSLQEKHWEPQTACLFLDSRGLSVEECAQRAIQLKRVLDSRGILIDVDALPNQPDYYDSTLRAHRYVLSRDVARIFVAQQPDGTWRFSAQTVAVIPQLHGELFPWGTEHIVNAFGDSWHRPIPGLGLQWYQLVMFLGWLLLGFLIYGLQTRFIGFVVRRVVDTIVHQILPAHYVRRVARPLSVVLVLWVLGQLIPVMQFSVRWAAAFNIGILKLALPFVITLTLMRILDVIFYFAGLAASRTTTNMDDQLIPILRKVSKIVLGVVATLLIIRGLNFDITSLLAGISIGGIAIALAAQDTLKNFFASVLIFLDKPFQLGDFVKVKDIEGVVESVGLRASRIRTFYNSLVYIPNAQLTDSNIDNMGLRQKRRYLTTLGLTYNTPPERLQLFVQQVDALCKAHPLVEQETVAVHFRDYADFSLQIQVRVFFLTQSWDDEQRARHELNVAWLQLVAAIGVSYAFPTQSLYVENWPQTKASQLTSPPPSLPAMPAHEPVKPITLPDAQSRADALLAQCQQDWVRSWPAAPKAPAV